MKRFLLFMLAMAVMVACTESDTQINLPNDNTENTTEGEDEGTDNPTEGEDEGTEKPDEGEDEGTDNPTEGEDEGNNNPTEGEDEGNDNPTEGEDEGTDNPTEGEDEGNDNPTEGEDGGNEDNPEGGNEDDPEGGNEDDDWVDDGLIEAMYPYDTSIWYNTPDGTQIGLTESPTNGAITGHMFGACANGMCYGYYTIDFDAVVTEIRAKAFYASALEVIFLPTMVREVGAEAFAACEALTTVHIGRNAKSIGDRAFADCVNLQALYLRTTAPPTLGASALPQDYATAGMLIYVPMEAVERYKADAAWQAYADIIVGHEYKYIPKNQ